MKSYFTSLLFLCLFHSSGQNTLKHKSLISKEDSLKIANLLEFGEQAQDTINLPDYFQQALILSKKLHYNYGIFKSYNKIAYWKKINFNSDSAIVWFKKGITELPDTSADMYYLLTNIGNEYKIQSKYDSALYYINREIQLATKSNNKKMIVYGYETLGNTYFNNFEHDNAFVSYAMADSICESNITLNYSKIHAEIQNYLGYVVRATQGYEKALKYYEKAKQIYEEINNTDGVQQINTAIAQAYISFNRNQEALDLLNESIAFQEKIPIRNSYSYAVIVRGFLLLKMERYAEAEKDYLLYYNLAVKTNDKSFQRRGLGYLASFYADIGNYDKAINNYKKTIQLCKAENDIGIEIMAIEGLISVYTVTKKYKEAVETYQEYVALLEQREKRNIKKQTNNLEAKYQAQKKEKEISILKTQNDLAEQEKKNQLSLLLAVILLLTFAGLFLFFLYRNRQKTNRKLRELDQLKSDFFTNISHEFRTPLTLISGPVQSLLNQAELSSEDRNNLVMIQRNSDRLTDLVSQLLDISKLESGILKLRVLKGNLMAFIGTIIDGFAFLANQKQINFTHKKTSSPTETWFDHDVLEKILVNLLSNAIKYTPDEGSVRIKTFIEDNKLTFRIKNTGSGFSEKEMEKIFDRFYQVNDTQQGVGVGLALVKELVYLHKGQISVISNPNWTTFTVHIPIRKEIYNRAEIVSKAFSDFQKPKTSLPPLIISKRKTENPNNHEKPLLLIVDDNPDVRTYIGGLFSESYTLLLAENGSVGIAIAIEHIPDIIISDIMMPVTDGISLCNTLKVDERTSHIPIILLTAKAGEEHELTGIKTGADDYITKPFKEELLKLKVENKIATRKKLQERYRQEIILTPKNIAVNSIDQKFLEKIKIELDTRLIEPTFGVEDLSQAVGMSRMQLHRKLKAFTGFSASEFIRTQRLKLAAQLLKNSDINISEIGYSVGFNNHAYFSKCFKEMYQCTPSEFANKLN